MSLKGKRALITGASRGIGRGIALELASRGVDVAINYVSNDAAANDTAAKVKAFGVRAITIKADVGNVEAVRGMVTRAGAELGGIDIFISNARTEVGTFYQPPMDITLEQWDTALDSQAKAFLVAMREVSKVMPNGGRSSPSLMLPAEDSAAGNRGSRWAQPSLRWRSSAATLPWR